MTPEQIKEIQRQSFERLGKGLDHGVQKLVGDVWYTARSNYDGTAETVWDDRIEFRIRPDTVNVFGMELPAPVPDGHGATTFYGFEFDSSTGVRKWQAFFGECISGKYAQPKKVTVEEINDRVLGDFIMSSTTRAEIAQKNNRPIRRKNMSADKIKIKGFLVCDEDENTEQFNGDELEEAKKLYKEWVQDRDSGVYLYAEIEVD